VVLTNVGLEHTRWLGPTVRDIAREKLAVVADGATLVVPADLHPDAREEAEQVPAARIVEAPPAIDVELGALGAFQRGNFALAKTAVEALAGPLDDALVRRAAETVRVPGRFHLIASGPLTILDGAHNPGGMRALAGTLRETILSGRPVVAVVSILDDKEATEMLRALLPVCDRVVCTSNANPRALSPATLASLTEQLDGPPTDVEADPHRALQLARERAGANGTVLATGSIYLVADLLREPGAPGARSRL
jgi:dihydrofolate synthase / folylpolyglutamate synthase